jgi:hypothetical protein
MITAVRARPKGEQSIAARAREFARFYGVTHQALASHLGFDLR